MLAGRRRQSGRSDTERQRFCHHGAIRVSVPWYRAEVKVIVRPRVRRQRNGENTQ